YHLSKAQCWLDVSFHEYSRNDRSDFPQLALDESVKLIDGMERGVSPMPTDTPLVNDARRLREDLWQRLRVIHGTPGFECAQQAVACGEVELVHAGNEFNQQQWRHSKPYIQIAEDLTNDAEALARQCHVEPAVVPPQEAVLTANVVFDFDKDTQRHIRPESLRSVDEVLRRASEEKRQITGVQLIGHADRLKGPTDQYNQGLSERRAQTVRQYLIGKGIAADAIKYEWRGDSEQVQACDGMSGAKLRECLLPNRRVEVKFKTSLCPRFAPVCPGLPLSQSSPKQSPGSFAASASSGGPVQTACAIHALAIRGLATDAAGGRQRHRRQPGRWAAAGCRDQRWQ
ncbi:MAG: OmpA family protein, partial [Stenotrophomonas sp.]